MDTQTVKTSLQANSIDKEWFLPQEMRAELEILKKENAPKRLISIEWLKNLLRYGGGFLFFGTILVSVTQSGTFDGRAILAGLAFGSSYFMPDTIPVGQGTKGSQIDAYLQSAGMIYGVRISDEQMIRECMQALQANPNGLDTLARAVLLHIERGEYLSAKEVAMLSDNLEKAGNHSLGAYGKKAKNLFAAMKRTNCAWNKSTLVGQKYGQGSEYYRLGVNGSIGAAVSCMDDYLNHQGTKGAWLDVDWEKLLTACITVHLSADTRQEYVDKAQEILKKRFFPSCITKRYHSDEPIYTSMDPMLLRLAVTKKSSEEALSARNGDVMQWLQKVLEKQSTTEKKNYIREFASALCLLKMESLEYDVLIKQTDGIVFDEELKQRMKQLQVKKKSHNRTLWKEHLPALKQNGMLCEFQALRWHASDLDILLNEIENAGEQTNLQYSLIIREKKHCVTLPDNIAISSTSIAECVKQVAGAHAHIHPRLLQAVDGSKHAMLAFDLFESEPLHICTTYNNIGLDYTFTLYTVFRPDPSNNIRTQIDGAKRILAQTDASLYAAEERLISAMTHGLSQAIQLSIDTWMLAGNKNKPPKPTPIPIPAQDDGLY